MFGLVLHDEDGVELCVWMGFEKSPLLMMFGYACVCV